MVGADRGEGAGASAGGRVRSTGPPLKYLPALSEKKQGIPYGIRADLEQSHFGLEKAKKTRNGAGYMVQTIRFKYYIFESKSYDIIVTVNIPYCCT